MDWIMDLFNNKRVVELESLLDDQKRLVADRIERYKAIMQIDGIDKDFLKMRIKELEKQE